jgi:hypothetical protein
MCIYPFSGDTSEYSKKIWVSFNLSRSAVIRDLSAKLKLIPLHRDLQFMWITVYYRSIANIFTVPPKPNKQPVFKISEILDIVKRPNRSIVLKQLLRRKV